MWRVIHRHVFQTSLQDQQSVSVPSVSSFRKGTRRAPCHQQLFSSGEPFPVQQLSLCIPVTAHDGETKGSARVGYPRDELERGAAPGGRRAHVKRTRGHLRRPFVFDLESDMERKGVDIADDGVGGGKTPEPESGWGSAVKEPDSRRSGLVSVRESCELQSRLNSFGSALGVLCSRGVR